LLPVQRPLTIGRWLAFDHAPDGIVDCSHDGIPGMPVRMDWDLRHRSLLPVHRRTACGVPAPKIAAQKARDRIIASAYSVRARLDARVSAPGDLG